eukprot:Opistho-2@10640
MEVEASRKSRDGVRPHSPAHARQGGGVAVDERHHLRGQRHVGLRKQLVDGNGLVLPHHAYAVHFPHVEMVRHLEVCEFGDEDLHAVCLGDALHTRRKVDAVTNHGVLHSLFRANVAVDDLASVDANAVSNRRIALLHAAPIEHLEIAPHLQCRHARAVRVIGRHKGHAEYGHHRVTNVLVENAVICHDGVDGAFKVLVKHVDQFAWIERFAELCERADVAEEHTDLLARSPELLSALLKHLFGKRWGHVPSKSVHHLLFLRNVLENNDDTCCFVLHSPLSADLVHCLEVKLKLGIARHRIRVLELRQRLELVDGALHKRPVVAPLLAALVLQRRQRVVDLHRPRRPAQNVVRDKHGLAGRKHRVDVVAEGLVVLPEPVAEGMAQHVWRRLLQIRYDRVAVARDQIA